MAEAGPPAVTTEPKPLSYTPKFLADKILTTRGSIEGERKLVTVLFADVTNFTAISEKLDPEEMHQVMDGCFAILMEEIHKIEGTINQFTGDGVMALFGAPLAHEDHAQRACHAALAIQKALLDYNATIKQRHGADFKMRIGLNSGPVVVGAIGDDLRMDYTAIGDTTNLSARMESLADPGTTRVSWNTYRLAGDYFEFKSLGTTRVKGKAEPQETYELKGPSRVTSRLDASAAHGLTSYAGRREELATLVKAFDKARTGSGQVLGILGEPGAGKSRLIYELRKSLDAGVTYLEGRCLQFGKSIAFLPLRDIVRTYFDVSDVDSPVAVTRKLMHYIEGLGLKNDESLAACRDLLGVPVDSGNWLTLAPKERKEKTFGVLRDFLLRESRKNPLVLVVDDLHWIDKTSEEFLDYLIRKLPQASILLLLVYRPEYRHERANRPGYHEISLTQLPRETGAKLIESILENTEISPDLIDFVLRRSDGNPLFIEELTRTLLESGAIRMASSGYVLDLNAAATNVPENIHGIIAARMDRLEGDVKRVVQMAAVIGRDFALRVLQRITGLHEELTPYLTSLQNLEFIYQKHLYPELAYIFKHALIQEVAYNSLLRQKRARYHEQAARAMEQLYVDRLEESYEILAHHYDKSENAEKAHTYLKLSGEKAIRTHFVSEAYDYLKKALTALDRQPPAKA
jgi:class 3 adenylate cyclase